MYLIEEVSPRLSLPVVKFHIGNSWRFLLYPGNLECTLQHFISWSKNLLGFGFRYSRCLCRRQHPV